MEITIKGKGNYYEISNTYFGGKKFYMFESCEEGYEAPFIITDDKYTPIMETMDDIDTAFADVSAQLVYNYKLMQELKKEGKTDNLFDMVEKDIRLFLSEEEIKNIVVEAC